MYLSFLICYKTYILLYIIFAIRFCNSKTENNPKKDKKQYYIILNWLVHRYCTHNMGKECKDRRLYFVIRITFFVFDDI